MLIRFVVSNFMSFKEETEFNMFPSKGNGSKSLTNHIKKTKSGIKVLKNAAIYGANASGKSNLVKAIEYIKNIVLNNNNNNLVPQSKRFRLDKDYLNKSTIFRIEYEIEGFHFDYAVEIFKGKINSEWLYLISDINKGIDNLLFERNKKEVTFGEYFNNSEDIIFATKYLKKELEENYSVLNLCYNIFDNNKILDTAYTAFEKIIIIDPDTIDPDYASEILMNQKSKDFAKKLLVNSRTGIEDLVVEKTNADLFFGIDDKSFKNELIDYLENNTPDGLTSEGEAIVHFIRKGSYNAFIKEKNEYYVLVLKTKHFYSDFLFDFEEESDGTNRIFELSNAFEKLVTEKDYVFIIDELERSMHPILVKELLTFYSINSNNNCQLIFTTHESHLLDDELFRRDEIWFTEKKLDGSTDFYPLSNFNPRGDKVLERGYLQGRYGGVPFIENFQN